MSRCVTCGDHHPAADLDHCYRCMFLEQERRAVMDERRDEWWRDEPMEPCS